MADTLWCGSDGDKLYLQSGQLTSTLKTSEDVSAIDTIVMDIAYDETNTTWCGGAVNKLYLTSGKFTSTLKDSEDVSAIEETLAGVSTDWANTPYSGNGTGAKLYLSSGKFTSTLKDSEDVNAKSASAPGLSYDGVNTPWAGQTVDKLFLQSGQFTSTIKTSQSITAIQGITRGVSYTGVDTLFAGYSPNKLVLLSGQFTSTVKDSETVSGVEIFPQGIDTDNLTGRLGGPAPFTGDASFSLPSLTVSAQAKFATVSITLPSLIVTTNFNPEVAITLPMLTIVGLGLGADLNGDVSLTLPSLTLDGAGHLSADTAVTLPMITLSARAVTGSVPDCVVMNTFNNAVSEYKGYWFNSYTKFNGVYLAANQNGIYELDDSDADNAGVDDFKIKAHIKTGVIDTYQDRVQRLRNAWLTFETDGDIRIRTRADEQTTRYYYLTFQNYVGIKERRVKFERGIRERHFDFKVENINGSDLEIDKLTVTLEPIVSKRR
jgi:hypothetical protein